MGLNFTYDYLRVVFLGKARQLEGHQQESSPKLVGSGGKHKLGKREIREQKKRTPNKRS